MNIINCSYVNHFVCIKLSTFAWITVDNLQKMRKIRPKCVDKYVDKVDSNIKYTHFEKIM